MTQYYTQEEILTAVEAAKHTVTSRLAFRYGYNDCISFAIEYDHLLRGDPRLGSNLGFDYNSNEEFFKGLKKKGFTPESLALASDYEVITNFRPKVGDIGYYDPVGVSVCDKKGWVSIHKTEGLKRLKPLMPLEKGFSFIIRPLRR